MESTRQPSSGERIRRGERGAVLVLVLVILLLFVTIGGFATLFISNMQSRVVNRAYASQAFYAAEAAVHAMVTQAMTDTDANPAIKLDDLTGLQIGSDATADAIIEAGPASEGKYDYRIWARGYCGWSPSGKPIQRYVRAYLRFDADSGDRRVTLVDMEEVRERVVAQRAHRSLPAESTAEPDPATDRIGYALHKWLPDDHGHKVEAE